MRTLPRPVQPTCPGHSQISTGCSVTLREDGFLSEPRDSVFIAKGAVLQLILSLATEGHRGQAWLCLLIFGVLCRSTWAYTSQDLTDLQYCLDNLKQFIQKSDAMLYAPSVDEIKDHCSDLSLVCYMLELEMVIIEEQVMERESDMSCIIHFREQLEDSNQDNNGSCPTCEATALRNSTIFLDNFKSLLIKRIVQMAHDDQR